VLVVLKHLQKLVLAVLEKKMSGSYPLRTSTNERTGIFMRPCIAMLVMIGIYIGAALSVSSYAQTDRLPPGSVSAASPSDSETDGRSESSRINERAAALYWTGMAEVK
jgi:hypothetical protein